MRHNLRKLSKNNIVLNNGENKIKFSVYYKNNYHTMKLAMEEWLLTSASASFTELKALNYLLA